MMMKNIIVSRDERWKKLKDEWSKLNVAVQSEQLIAERRCVLVTRNIGL